MCHIRWRPKGRRHASLHPPAHGPDNWSICTEWERLISLKGPEGFITISQQTIVLSLEGWENTSVCTYTHSSSLTRSHFMRNIVTHPWLQKKKKKSCIYYQCFASFSDNHKAPQPLTHTRARSRWFINCKRKLKCQSGIKQLRGFLFLTFTSCCFFVSGENPWTLYSSLNLWILWLAMKQNSHHKLLRINTRFTLTYMNYNKKVYYYKHKNKICIYIYINILKYNIKKT